MSMKRKALVMATVVVTSLVVMAAECHAQAAFPEPTVPAEWKELDAGGLCELAAALVAKGASGAAERILLADYVASKYLNSPAATKSVAASQWRQFAQLCGSAKGAEVQAAWAAALRNALIPDKDAAGRLSKEDVGQVMYALAALGAKDPRGIRVLWLEGKYLGSDEAARSLSAAEWLKEVKVNDPALTPESRAVWAQALHAAFAGTEAAVGAMSDEEYAATVGLLRRLKDPQCASVIVARANAFFLATPETIRSRGVGGWQRLVQDCDPALTPEIRAAWASKIREAFLRGTLNNDGDAITDDPVPLDVHFGFDALGNWRTLDMAINGTTTLSQTREHNAANEVDTNDNHADTGNAITASTGSDWFDPVYDAAGNTVAAPRPGNESESPTGGEQDLYVYDAWCRLVEVWKDNDSDGVVDRGDPTANPVVAAVDTLVAEYRYDGLHRRVAKLIPTAFDGDNLPTTYTRIDRYLSVDWQVLEERQATEVSAASPCGLPWQYSYRFPPSV